MLFINGAWRKGAGDAFTSLSPVDNSELWRGHEASKADIDEAITTAHEAFLTWRKKPFAHRLAIIEAFSDALKENKDDLARTIARETGKALWDASGEVAGMIGKGAISVKAYMERTGTHETEAAGAKLRIAHKPHGVMAVLGPFNFPGHLPNGHIIPALLAGNTIVFKPSEMTPLVAEKTLKLWEQSGLPKGVINLVHGARRVGEELIAHEKTRGVLFTGGVPAGLAIHKALGGQPEKILALELGGNNPLIVWDAADKTAAARIIIRSAFISAGQRCTCTRRLIIEDGPSGDALIETLNELTAKLTIDKPEADPQPFMGALISAKAAEEALAAQANLIKSGAMAIREMTTAPAGPAFVTPAILDVTKASNRPDAEVFAPMLQIIRVKTFDAALEEANNTKFGLAAGLLSDKKDLWERFALEIDAGVVNWNRQTTGASGAAPFGGVGHSGNHRPAGYYAADYCAWPMASLLGEGPVSDDVKIIGIDA